MDKRADKHKADDPFSGGGGGAVDDLTPPTMKYGPGGASADSSKAAPAPGGHSGLDATIAGPGNVGGAGELTRLGATQIAPQKTLAKTEITTGNGATSPTIGGQQISTVVGSVAAQDLSNEKLLRDAPQVESNGRLCPALNGIPLWAKLGQGGMGAVYYGIHPRLRSEVAVKVLPFHLAAQDPSMIQRFYREAQIAAKVRSPHLVSVIDVNEESGLFFLVMEYVAGITMGQYIKQLKEKQVSSGETVGMPELDAIDVMIAASKGLDAAHSNGIVHRDLKPENIMVPYKSRQNKNYDLKNAKLMDLGLARNEEGQQSLTGGQAAMGTPGYMAPEQALDAKTADKRSDVFGMGATIYALLSGRPPFQGDAVMKVLMATMHEPHEPIGNLRPDISAALAEVVDRCLDKRPENRYADSHELIRALKNCRRLIAPEGDDEGDERDGKTGLSGSTHLTPTRAGTTAPNMSATTRPLSGQYQTAGQALSTAKNMTAVGAAPKKGMLPAIIGIAACLVLVAGVGAYKFWPSPVVDPGKKDPGVVELLPQSKIKLFVENQTQNLTKARNAILDGEADLAQGNLDYASDDYQAKSKNLPKEIAEKAHKDIEELKLEISEFRKKNLFASSLKTITTKLADDQLKEAQDIAKALVPANDEQKAALERKFKEIDDKKAQLTTKTEVAKFLAAAQKPGIALPDALAQVNSALKLMPDNAEALELLRSFETKQKQLVAEKEYTDAIAKTRSLWEKKEYASANLEVGKALMAKPNDKDAEALRNQIQAKLSAAELEAQAKQERLSRQEKLNSTFTTADQLYKANKGTEALAEIEEALKIAALLKDEAADGYLKPLKAKIVVLVQKQADEAVALKKKRDYEELLTKAKALLKADDTNGFASALEYTDKATALYSSGPEAQEAASVKGQIEARKVAWDNLKLHNTAVSSARQLLGSVKEDNIEAARTTIESASKKIDEALAIIAGGKIAVDQLKDPKVAEALKAQIAAKKSAIEAIVAKQAQYKNDYATAIKTGDDLFLQKNYFGALTTFEKGKEAALALGFEQKTELELKINKAKSKLEQVNTLFTSVDQLIKEDRFDDAMAKLTEGEKSMIDARFETKKADVQKSISALDGIVKTAMDTAGASVKAGKFSEALELIKAQSAAHKSRKDLAQTLTAMQKIQDVVNQGVKDADGFDGRFGNISGRLGERLRLTQKDFKKYVADLRDLNKVAGERLSTAGIASAEAEANALTSIRSTLVSKAEKELLALETAVNNTTTIQNTQVIQNNGNTNNGGGKDGPDREK